MFSAKIIKGNKIEILTDDPTVENFLKGGLDESGYNVWTKKFGAYKTTVHIFERGRHNLGGGKFKYILGLGWAAYVMSAFSNVISLDDWTCLRNAITSSEYRDIPFPNLRDYQNSDVLFLLKYKIGLFQVNTSYGKTETIATLANYFVGSGKRVLS